MFSPSKNQRRTRRASFFAAQFGKRSASVFAAKPPTTKGGVRVFSPPYHPSRNEACESFRRQMDYASTRRLVRPRQTIALCRCCAYVCVGIYVCACVRVCVCANVCMHLLVLSVVCCLLRVALQCIACGVLCVVCRSPLLVVHRSLLRVVCRSPLLVVFRSPES